MTLEQNCRYLLEESAIGRGTFSSTQTATIAVGNKRLMAAVPQKAIVKTLAPQLRDLPEFERFKRHFSHLARRLRRCPHPNLARTIDYFEDGGNPYIVYEAIAGRSLSEIIEGEGPFPAERALRYIEQASQALAALHAAGLQHLDLNPAHLLLREETDEVVAIEFGLTAELSPAIKQTRANLLSPGFAAPEQYQPKADCTPATDIYALAATLYYLLTGNPPPPAPLLDRIPSESWQKFPHDLPKAISGAILQGLHLDPQQRPQTVSAWRSLLTATAVEEVLEVETQLQPEAASSDEIPAPADDAHLEALASWLMAKKAPRAVTEPQIIETAAIASAREQPEPVAFEVSPAAVQKEETQRDEIHPILEEQRFTTAAQATNLTALEPSEEADKIIEIKAETPLEATPAEGRDWVPPDAIAKLKATATGDFWQSKQSFGAEKVEKTNKTFEDLSAIQELASPPLPETQSAIQNSAIAEIKELKVGEQNDSQAIEFNGNHESKKRKKILDKDFWRIKKTPVEEAEILAAATDREIKKVEHRQFIENFRTIKVARTNDEPIKSETAAGTEIRAESLVLETSKTGDRGDNLPAPEVLPIPEVKPTEILQAPVEEEVPSLENSEAVRDAIARSETFWGLKQEQKPENLAVTAPEAIEGVENPPTAPVEPVQSSELGDFFIVQKGTHAKATQRQNSALPQKSESPQSANSKRALTLKQMQSAKLVLGWLSRIPLDKNPIARSQFPLRALFVTCAIAASAGAGFGLSVRVHRPEEAGSSVWHLKQSFPPRDSDAPSLEEQS